MLYETKLRRLLMVISVIFVTSQVVFFVLKYYVTNVTYVLVSRLQIITLQQFAMLFGSAFIWWNLSPVIRYVSNDITPQLSCKHYPTFCLQSSLKGAIVLLLLLTHISSTFYYLGVGEEPNIFALISLLSLAVFVHLVFFLLLFLLLNSVYRLALRISPLHLNIIRWLVANELLIRLSAVSLAFVSVFFGFSTTLLPPIVRHVTIKIENLPDVQESFTIALLTDIHIGPTVGRSRVQKMVEVTNALKPDLIAISGDLADGFVRDLGEAAFPLSDLSSKYGVYFATGNHEYLYGSVEEWFMYLEKSGITPLHNKNKKIAVGHSVICLAGVDDLFATYSRLPGHVMDYKKALWGCGSNDTTIMLIHQPNAVHLVLKDTEVAKNVDLILSGHTHAGQMYIFIPLVYFWNAYFCGLYYDEVTQTYVYVSAGVNYFGPPVKVFGGSEVVFIRLSSGKFHIYG